MCLATLFQRLRFAEFLADIIVRYSNLLTYLLTKGQTDGLQNGAASRGLGYLQK